MAAEKVARILAKMRKRTEEILRPKRMAMEAVQVPPEKADQQPMILLSCRVPMGTRYIGRGKSKNRFLQQVG